MKIAIIGGGFAGSSAASLLHPEHEVTLFEKGSSTSAIAAGLLHKFAGLHAHKNPFADEAYEESLQFIKKNSPSAITETPIIRLAMDLRQETSFRKSAKKYPELQWIANAKTLGPFPEVPALIVSGAVVDTERYLQDLKRKLNVQEKEISSLEELSSFDKILIASGPACFSGMESLPVHLIKGQLLEFEFREPLQYPLNAHAYLISQNSRAILGATYERGFTSLEPDLQTAIKELAPAFHEIFPNTAIPHPVVKAGVRVTTPDRLPIVKKINERTVVFTGLGSKGLLYHVLFAKKAIELLIHDR